MTTTTRSPLAALGEDLLNRQINLIVTPGGMIAQPIPPLREALVDLATKYARALDVTLHPVPTPDPRVLADAFRVLQDAVPTVAVSRAALAGTTDPSSQVAEGFKRDIRMATHIDEILALLFLDPDLAAPTPEQLAAVQRAWEIGTDVVAMQTTVSIDGDVVTRVHGAFAGVEHRPLWDLHQRSVETSMSTWATLVDSAIALVGTIFGR